MTLKIINPGKGVDPAIAGAVVAVARFDGVHRGHQKLIAEAAQAAKRLGARLGAVTLEPLSGAAARLTSLEQQGRLLEALGVDFLHVLPSASPLAARLAIVRETLRGKLDALHAIIDPELAAEFQGASGAIGAFGLSVTLAESSEPNLSASIHAALKAGRPDQAATLLGRPFCIEGVVVEGQKLGRVLGYPTANVAASDYVVPRLGVYATRSRLPDGRELPGVANFGVNPTTGLVDARLETWLFDFDEDIYGQVLQTDLVAFLRPELKFDGLPTLIDQIGKDADAARAILLPTVAARPLIARAG